MKSYTAPKLTVYGKVQDLTQVVGSTGGNDTFFNADGSVFGRATSTEDVRSTTQVTLIS
ncbi:lasso peptide [Chrysosporum bergii ANA360D]|uniref:Lasso peptide n=1 Tax=Chrysosporum bergii ANA360D TaxID=617107 RepID=A0AA43KB37_9CYAN|nr:lasso peptide [Chrysosporum bergii]MDH6060131.1 lasso peptide [Chrysosporum bergii ANA360D]